MSEQQPSAEALATVERLEVWLETTGRAGQVMDPDAERAELARWFDRFARERVEAERMRLAKIEEAYQSDVASLNNCENCARGERMRIVSGLRSEVKRLRNLADVRYAEGNRKESEQLNRASNILHVQANKIEGSYKP